MAQNIAKAVIIITQAAVWGRIFWRRSGLVILGGSVLTLIFTTVQGWSTQIPDFRPIVPLSITSVKPSKAISRQRIPHLFRFNIC